jgi:V8-like Glu-specific endopeptidase
MADGVGKLHFWGERELPLTASDLAARTPIIGTRRIPKELRHNGTPIYVATSEDAEPTIEVSEFGGQAGRRLWQVVVTEDEDQGVTELFGKTAVREKPELIRNAINPKADFTGYRPEWSDLFYLPRVLPSTSPGRLRRINGRGLVEPAYVYGADARQVYQDTGYPWRCVGRVTNNEGKAGSGALVGPDLMVTAGHVVPWNSVNAGSWWMKFVPDFFDSQSLIGAGVQSNVEQVLGYSAAYYSGSVAGYDWAICKLYNPLGSSWGYFGWNSYSSDWENWPVWMVAGYPAAVAQGLRPSWQGGISILDDDGDSNDGDELESETADISPGNSGGPIWGWWNNDPRIIGVVSGWQSEYIALAGTEDNNIFASGSGLGNLIAWGRSNW